MILKATTLLLLAVGFILASFGLALSQAIMVDHVDGLDLSGMLSPGATLTFHMRVIGDGTNHLMLNNGFVFSSADASWGNLTGGFILTYPVEEWFDFVQVMNFWANGSGEDTVGVGLLSLFGEGLPAGFDGVLYVFTIGPVDGPAGSMITFDSSWYPPSNPWMWDVVSENVAWGGPYSYLFGCSPCGPETYCAPQPTVLKQIDRVLYIYIQYENVGDVDLESIRIQGNIPSYEPAYIEGGTIVASVFIMRFLGASGFRPVTGDFEATYTVDYNYNDGTPAPTLVGDFSLKVYPGDVTLDGRANIDDLIFAADYFWRNGGAPAMRDHTGQTWEVNELLDVDGNGEINPLDVRAMMGMVGL